jgi:hypothetical protein
MNQRTFYGWAEKFQGETSFDVACCGRSSAVVGVLVKKLLNQRIPDNPRVRTDKTVVKSH